MSGEIIAVEGACCAGKTTLIKSLATHLQAGVIPELPEFARNLFKPFETGEEILHNGYQSIAVEQVRLISAAGLSKVAGHVVMDRCFLSTLALGYGAIDVIGAPAYRALSKSVLAEVAKEEVPIPDKALYLRVDSKTVEERNRTRVPRLDDYWTSGERIDRQNEFYHHLASSIGGIALVNAEQAPEAVLLDCIGYAMDSERISRKRLVGAAEDFNTGIR